MLNATTPKTLPPDVIVESQEMFADDCAAPIGVLLQLRNLHGIQQGDPVSYGDLLYAAYKADVIVGATRITYLLTLLPVETFNRL